MPHPRLSECVMFRWDPSAAARQLGKARSATYNFFFFNARSATSWRPAPPAAVDASARPRLRELLRRRRMLAVVCNVSKYYFNLYELARVF